jgi:hypothetical protein
MPTSMHFSNVHTHVLPIHELLHITSQNTELVKANYSSKNINRTTIKEDIDTKHNMNVVFNWFWDGDIYVPP